MANLTFQFSRPEVAQEDCADKLVTLGIMKLTRSEICHVDLVLPDGTLLGAHAGSGVQVRPADYETWGLRLRVNLLVSDATNEAMIARAKSKVGTKYDLLDIVGIMWGDARLDDPKELICSSFITELLDNKDYTFIRVAKDHWQVTPEELRLILTSQPGATEQRLEGNIKL